MFDAKVIEDTLWIL